MKKILIQKLINNCEAHMLDMSIIQENVRLYGPMYADTLNYTLRVFRLSYLSVKLTVIQQLLELWD